MKFCKDCRFYTQPVHIPFTFSVINAKRCMHPSADELRDKVDGALAFAEDVRRFGCGPNGDWFESREDDK